MMFIMPMTMIIMALPGMSPTQHYRTILLGPVKYPKPHDGAKAFSGDSVPPLRLMDGNALVRYAISMSSSHLLLSLSLCKFV